MITKSFLPLPFFVCFLLVVCGIGFLYNAFLKIVENIYRIQEQEKMEERIEKKKCFVLFFVFFVGALSIVQRHINEIAEKNRENIVVEIV